MSILDILPKYFAKNFVVSKKQTPLHIVGSWNLPKDRLKSIAQDNSRRRYSEEIPSLSYEELVQRLNNQLGVNGESSDNPRYRVVCPDCNEQGNFYVELSQIHHYIHWVDNFDFSSLLASETVQQSIDLEDNTIPVSVLLELASDRTSAFTRHCLFEVDIDPTDCVDVESYQSGTGITFRCRNCDYEYYYEGAFDYT